MKNTEEIKKSAQVVKGWNTSETNVTIERYRKAGLIATDEISDGVKDFGTLYEEQAILLAVIAMQNRENAWKARTNVGKKEYNEFFIVGIGDYQCKLNTKFWKWFSLVETKDYSLVESDHSDGIEVLYEMIRKNLSKGGE